MWATRSRRVRALQELGASLCAEGRFDEAVATLDEGVALAQGSRLREPVRADMLHTRAAVLLDVGRWEEGERSAREAIAVRRGLGSVLDRDQRERLSQSLELLANVLTAARRPAEADALTAEVLAMRGRSDWSERARALLNRSATLLELGRTGDGLDVAMELVRSGLAEEDRTSLADVSFVDGLANLAVLLRRNGHWDQALDVQELAVSGLRALAATGDREMQGDLAMTLSNHSLMHLECGRPEEAIRPGAEALAIREELAAWSAEAFGPALTDSLNNQAIVLHRLGRHEEAEVLAARCLALRRRLHAALPRAFERKLANAATTHADVLTACGRAQEALAPAHEGVRRLRALQAVEPGHHVQWLAGALETWAAALAASGAEERAFTVSAEAVDVARQAYATNPAGAGNLLAEILVSTAQRHAEREAALPWAEEGVDVLRTLSREQPAAHAVALAKAEELLAGLEPSG